MKLIKYTFSTPLCSHRTKGVEFSAIIYKHKSIKCCFYTPMLYNMTKGVEIAGIFCKHKFIKLTFYTPMLYNMTKGVEIAGIFCKHKSQIIKSIEKNNYTSYFSLMFTIKSYTSYFSLMLTIKSYTSGWRFCKCSSSICLRSTKRSASSGCSLCIRL